MKLYSSSKAGLTMVSIVSLLIAQTTIAQEATPPDLVFTDVHISGRGATSDDPVFPGENVVLSVTLTNQGGSLASTAQVRIQVDDPNGNSVVTALILSGAALRAGETTGTSTAIPLSPNAIPGTYTIDLVADPDNAVAESNEANNTQTVNFYVAPASGGTPPMINITAAPATLWPPNGKMVLVTVSGTIIDAESGVDLGTAAYEVIDEYGLIQPSGQITTLDASGRYSFRIQLQASRKGNDRDGRLYTIIVSAQDNEGNQGSNSTVVTVPHDQR